MDVTRFPGVTVRFRLAEGRELDVGIRGADSVLVILPFPTGLGFPSPADREEEGGAKRPDTGDALPDLLGDLINSLVRLRTSGRGSAFMGDRRLVPLYGMREAW